MFLTLITQSPTLLFSPYHYIIGKKMIKVFLFKKRKMSTFFIKVNLLNEKYKCYK